MAPSVGLAAFIVDELDDLVLIKRGSEFGYSQIALVGGKLQHGEEPSVGISREVEEEIGVSILPEDFSRLNTYTNTIIGDKHYITLWFLARLPSGTEPKINEPHNILEIFRQDVCGFWQNRYRICRDQDKYFAPLRDFCFDSECLKELRKKWLTLNNNFDELKTYETNSMN